LRGNKFENEFEELDVQFFDISFGLTEEMVQLMNTKISEIRNGY
jgi:hypothetical protein